MVNAAYIPITDTHVTHSMKYIVTLVVLVVIVFALRHYMPVLGSSVATGVNVVNGLPTLGACPGTPNCQHSEASQADQRVERFPITTAPDVAIASLARVVEAMPGMSVVQFNETYLYATHTSSLMRFVDDVEFLVSDDNSSIQVRSASRLGKSDLGANAKRIASLRELAAGKL